MAKKEMVLYGKNTVYERLRTNPKSIRKISLQDNFDSSQIEKIIRAQNIPVGRLSHKEFSKFKADKNPQGIIAIIDGFTYASFEEFLSLPEDKRLTLVFLDRIYDPQNLGAIIRTLACFGRFGVIIPRHEACGVTETVLNIASGGENYIPVAMVTNITSAIIMAKAKGYWVMGGMVSDEARTIHEISIPFPLGLVLGSEGEGIRQGVQKLLDIQARIPMGGAKLSFNIATACAIFCYEISRQREGVT
ncbi:MAG: 23S rRNA (guanosine(2251)-2'-O)-methyltransferase RlmB [Candidatus Omnitrophota bacterium]